MLSSQQEEDGCDGIYNTQDSPSHTTNARSTLKRKELEERSDIWDHFEKIRDEGGCVTSAKCNYCDRIYKCHKEKSGTPSLRCHMDACMKDHQDEQTHLTLSKTSNHESTSRKIEFDRIRKAIARKIIVDELPFKFVEGEGFKGLMRELCPRFEVPSRWLVARDCYQLYVNERTKLKSFLEDNCQRVSLTTNTWTSLQGISYMCITAHFIDNEWNLHRKILNFVPVTNRDDTGKSLEKCVLDWGLKNVFTVTIDIASSSDTVEEILSKRLVNWGNGVGDGKYIHMRCVAHVVNLMVVEGLKHVNPSVERVRNAVRYIRISPARLRKFKKCADHEGIKSKCSLCLDVVTRWDSTYMMLKTAVIFENAFERYEREELSYVADLGKDAVPSSYDWACIRKLSGIMEHFYAMMLRYSDPLRVNSNSFFSEISDLCYYFDEWTASDDVLVKNLGESMELKFDKYWGEPEKMNKLIFWASVFDPREKFGFVEFCLNQMYGDENGGKILVVLKDGLLELFKEYAQKYQQSNDANASESSDLLRSSLRTFSDFYSGVRFRAKYKRLKMEIEKKTELEVYLNENIIEGPENLDLLKWWKNKSEFFPILSKMARDILAIPISAVASEATFSTCGTVLDQFRSSLTPKLVEALICGKDWLPRSETPTGVEEQIDELENFERELPSVGIVE